MLVSFLILLFGAALVVVNKKVYGRIICFPSVITAIWSVTLALAMLGLFDVYVPPFIVVVYAAIFIATLNISYYFFNKSIPKGKKRKKLNYTINNSFFSWVLVVCIATIIVSLWDGIMVFISDFSFESVRNDYINYRSVGVHLQVLLSITVFPIGKAVCIYSIIDYIYNKKVRSCLVLSALFIIVGLITTGGRGMLFSLLLITVIVLYDKDRGIMALIKNNRKLAIAAVFIIIALLFVTFQRGFSDNNVLKSIYVYFAGCFNLLGVYLKEPEVYFGSLLFGQVLVSGVTFPFIELLRVFGLNILPGNYIIANDALSKYVAISPNVAINATPTTMYSALRDFGWGGLVVYPTAICFVYCKLKAYARRHDSIMTKALLVNFISGAILLQMSFQFGTFQVVSCFLYIYLLYKISRWMERRGECKDAYGVLKTNYFRSPYFLLLRLAERRLFPMSDKFYIRMRYKEVFGKRLNLETPVTFNEKLQWLKLYDRDPMYTSLVDKYEVKKYIEERLGKGYVINTLGVYNTFDEIDFSKLPNQFVLKCTHDSGGIIICKDKTKLDKKLVKKQINKALRRDFYHLSREWPYKNVVPRIIAEEYIEDDGTKELRDYKFFVFSGKAKAMFVASNRQGDGETYFDFFDNNYKHLDVINGHPMNPILPKMPNNFKKMIKLAETLAGDMCHVRVDFYEANNRIYFGEMTFYHWSGLMPFGPEEWDRRFGDWIKLPENKVEDEK